MTQLNPLQKAARAKTWETYYRHLDAAVQMCGCETKEEYSAALHYFDEMLEHRLNVPHEDDWREGPHG